MAKKKVQIPLNDLLGNMDRGNSRFYRDLPKEQQEVFNLGKNLLTLSCYSTSTLVFSQNRA